MNALDNMVQKNFFHTLPGEAMYMPLILGAVGLILSVALSYLGALWGVALTAAALVGTFLGILLCYGLVGPVAANLGKVADDEHAYYQVLRVVLVAFLKGTSPMIAVEIGRRAIPSRVRPTFEALEQTCKSSGATTAAAAATAA